MRVIRASELPKEKVSNFLENHQQINSDDMLQSGYVIEIQGQICGCFLLKHIEKGLYILRRFYITKTEALKIPIFIESIILLAKQKKATAIFVQSHKLMIDIILEALQFHPQGESDFLDKYTKNDGKWWSYAL